MMPYYRGVRYHRNWPDSPVMSILDDGTAIIEAERSGERYALYIRDRLKECFSDGRPDIDLFCYHGGYLVVDYQIPGSGAVELCPTDETWQFLIVIDPLLQEAARDQAILWAIAQSFLFERDHFKPVLTGIGQRTLRSDQKHPKLQAFCKAFCRTLLPYQS